MKKIAQYASIALSSGLHTKTIIITEKILLKTLSAKRMSLNSNAHKQGYQH